MPRAVDQMAMQGSTVFISSTGDSRETRIFVVDATDPARPQQIGSFARRGVGHHFTATGSRLYVTSLGQFEVVDAGDPRRPVSMGSLDTQSLKAPLAVGNHAYVARHAMRADEGGLQVIDVADPSRPVEISSITTGSLTDFAVSGSHLYLLSDGLRVVDVSDPSHPTEVAVLRDPSWNLEHLAAAGSRLYAIGGIRGRQGSQLLIFDVSNPRQPTRTATHALEGMDFPFQLAASDRFVVVAGSHDLRVFDATDPSRLSQVAETSRFERLGNVVIVGDDLFIGGSFLGLWILRLTRP
jgi:hypothetical protein